MEAMSPLNPTIPTGWSYDKRDGKNLLAIHKAYGSIPLRTYPYMLPRNLFWYLYVDGIKSFPILNYLDYSKQDALSELKKRFGYRQYKRKHGENRFTRFYQEIYLPKKFGIDKRINHLSSLILSGQITRTQALAELEKPLYSQEEEIVELQYVAKKLGYTFHEFQELILKSPRLHTDFDNAASLFDHSKPYVQLARRIAKGEFKISGLKSLIKKDYV